MKPAQLAFLISSLILATGIGCKSPPKPVTDLPSSRTPDLGANPNQGTPIRPVPPGGVLTQGTGTDRGLNGDLITGRPPAGSPEDTEALAAQTIYFEFDKSSIKPSERPKLEAVGAYLKQNPGVSLKIEGHCDERGTEEYNRALGERRAIAAMEFLIQAQGIDSGRITTVSFGEDKPADTGKDEAAYARNRRDQFVILQVQ